MASDSFSGETPSTWLAFPQTEADYQALLTRLRQGSFAKAEIPMEEATLKLIMLRDRCQADLDALGVRGSLSLGQVAEAIRVSTGPTASVIPIRGIADPSTPANAAGQVERPGTARPTETAPEAPASREIPARPASAEELPTFDDEPVRPTLLKETLIGAVVGVGVSFFSRKLGAAILGWTALRFVIHHYAPIPADELDEPAEDHAPAETPAEGTTPPGSEDRETGHDD